MPLAVNVPAKRASGHRIRNSCVGSNPALSVAYPAHRELKLDVSLVCPLFSSLPCAELPERLRGSTRSLHYFFLFLAFFAVRSERERISRSVCEYARSSNAETLLNLNLKFFFSQRRERESAKKNTEKNFRKKKREEPHPHRRVTFLRTNYTFTHTKTRKGTISRSHSATCTTFDRDLNPFVRFAVRV